jgi:hypothetical protein
MIDEDEVPDTKEEMVTEMPDVQKVPLSQLLKTTSSDTTIVKN